MKEFKIANNKFTDTDENLLRYFNDVSKEKTLTAQEEGDLAFLAKEGDQSAKDRIIKANLRFVISVAKQYTQFNISLGDLISEGNKGLLEAIERFNPSTGFKFISYAVWHIRKNMLLYISENSRQIKLPLNVVAEIRKYQRVEEEFLTKIGRLPSMEEVLDLFEEKGEYKISGSTITTIKQNVTTVPLSPEGSEDPDKNFGPINYLASSETSDSLVIESSRGKSLDRAFNRLKAINSIYPELLKLKYGMNEFNEEYTYKQIGDKYERTAEWARGNIKKAERRFRVILTKDRSLRNELGD
jgi:RNA polymerase primary sigma factor